MSTDTKTLSERLRTDAAYMATRITATSRQIGRDCAEAADALDAKDALLREAMKALKPFSVIADGTDFLGDGQSVSVNVNRCRDARAILSKLTEATKP